MKTNKQNVSTILLIVMFFTMFFSISCGILDSTLPEEKEREEECENEVILVDPRTGIEQIICRDN